MATDDQQVLVTGTASAPTHFTIPGNGQIQPKSVFAHFDGAGASSAFVPALKVISDGGEVVAICPCPTTVAAAGSADVTWFPHVGLTLLEGLAVGVTVETLLVDTRSSSGATSSVVLASGVEYVITAQGTFSNTNNNLDVGTPNSDALFPTSPPPARSSTQVGLDPECIFAYFSGSPPAAGIGHNTNNFQMNLGSGFQYVTPQDGAHSTPSPNYLYTYKVTGQGSTASFKFNDEPGQFSDNYGYIQVTIQSLNGSSGGGGGGSLVPPAGSNHSILRVASGVAAWEAQPDVAEADLSLSDVTTANVSTTKHGFAPKAPNDATKFLDGTGAYSVPGGGGGTISDITSTGSSITVGSPTGPTTNVDVANSGVAAATYGDATHVSRVAIGADGRVTSASNVAISGLSGSGMVKIFDSTLGAAAATIDTGAGGIPSGHSDLIIFAIVQTADAGANVTLKINVNNDTAANYDIQVAAANNGTTTFGAAVAQTSWRSAIHGGGGSGNYPGILRMFIPSYDLTTFNKVCEFTSGLVDGTAANAEIDARIGGWRSTAAISRLAIAANSGANLNIGSRLVIYGAQ